MQIAQQQLSMGGAHPTQITCQLSQKQSPRPHSTPLHRTRGGTEASRGADTHSRAGKLAPVRTTAESGQEGGADGAQDAPL